MLSGPSLGHRIALVAISNKLFVIHCIIPCVLFLGYSVAVGEFSGDATEGTMGLEGGLSHSLLREIVHVCFWRE